MDLRFAVESGYVPYGLVGTALAFIVGTLDDDDRLAGECWRPAVELLAGLRASQGFEVMVLFAGFSMVFAFSPWHSYFSRQHGAAHSRGDCQSLRHHVEEPGDFDVDAVRHLSFNFGRARRRREGGRGASARISLRPLNSAVGVELVGSRRSALAARLRSAMPDMNSTSMVGFSLPYDSFSHPLLPHESTMQPPHRAPSPRASCRYRAAADAVRAGIDLIDPLSRQESRWLPRRTRLSAIFLSGLPTALACGDDQVATDHLGKSCAAWNAKVTAVRFQVLTERAAWPWWARAAGEGPVVSGLCLPPGRTHRAALPRRDLRQGPEVGVLCRTTVAGGSLGRPLSTSARLQKRGARIESAREKSLPQMIRCRIEPDRLGGIARGRIGLLTGPHLGREHCCCSVSWPEPGSGGHGFHFLGCVAGASVERGLAARA